MGMFTVYVDDSGTNDEARIVTGACCVASVSNWKKFERRWLEIGKEAGFKYFHMTEFAGCRPDEWCRDCRKGKQTEENHPWRDWSNKKRKRVLKELASSVNEYSSFGIGIAIGKEDYDNLILNAPLKDMLEPVTAQDKHLMYTLQSCAGAIAKWRDQQRLTKPMQYVFDGTDDLKLKHQISEIFASTDSGIGAPLNDGMTTARYSFQNRRSVVQLLSADMLAWVSAKQRAYEVFGTPIATETNIVRHIFAQGKKLIIGKIPTKNMEDFAKREMEHHLAKKKSASE